MLHTLSIDMLLKLTPLLLFQFMSFPLHFVTTSVWKVLISFLHLLRILFFVLLSVIILLGSIRLYEIDLHQVLYLLLFLSIFLQLLLDKPRELLFLSDFDLSIEILQTPFSLDLAHVLIENVFVAHFVTAHENSFAKLVSKRGSMDEGETCLACDIRGGVMRLVSMISDSFELMLSSLRVWIRNLHVTRY